MSPVVIGDATLYLGDCLDVLPTLGKVDAVVTDPPYFGVKGDDWDNQWRTKEDFLSWLDLVITNCADRMEDWASFYLFTSPQMNWAVEGLVRNRLVFLNSIRWQKPQGWQHKQPIDALRIFQQNWEGCIFAQKGDDTDAQSQSGYEHACDALHKKVYQPIGGYFRQARENAGLSYRQIANSIGRDPALYLRWEEGSSLPNAVDYAKCQALFQPTELRKDYEELRKDYEELRKDYEELRRPFLPYDPRMKSDNWVYDTVGGYFGKHPCEKPISLMTHIVGSSSKTSQTILDPFMGSGTTGVAAIQLGRKFIGIEREPKYFDIACRRIEQAYNQRPLFEPEPTKQPEQLGLDAA